jgi:hypothetical protein
LKSGQISLQKFDFHFLRWEGGRYGMNALNILAAGTDAYTKRMVRTVLQQRNKYDMGNEAVSLEGRITVYPRGQKLPPSFLKFDWQKPKTPLNGPNCPVAETCSAVLTDLDGDGKPEILILPDRAVFAQVFHQEETGAWSQVATIRLTPGCAGELEALRQSHFETRPPLTHWSDIVIGGARLHTEEADGIVDPPACPK